MFCLVQCSLSKISTEGINTFSHNKISPKTLILNYNYLFWSCYILLAFGSRGRCHGLIKYI